MTAHRKRGGTIDKKPWMKFFPSDWRADKALALCSIGARGLWLEMLCLMHEAKPYGHLTVNGHAVTDTQLAMLTRTTPDQISELIGELEAAGVFLRNGKGVIYSKRMTRDQKKSKTAHTNGKNGGNPDLNQKGLSNRSKRKKSSSVKQGDNPPLKGEDKTHIPESRVQKEKSVKKEDGELMTEGTHPSPIDLLGEIKFVSKDSAPTLYAAWVDQHGADEVDQTIVEAFAENLDRDKLASRIADIGKPTLDPDIQRAANMKLDSRRECTAKSIAEAIRLYFKGLIDAETAERKGFKPPKNDEPPATGEDDFV